MLGIITLYQIHISNPQVKYPLHSIVDQTKSSNKIHHMLYYYDFLVLASIAAYMEDIRC